MSILEGQELDDVQQSSSDSSPAETTDAGAATGGQTDATDHTDEQSGGQDETEHAEGQPNALEPGGERFKQVWARAKAAEAKATQVEAEARQEREARIRLEERLAAQEAEKTKSQPKYTWEQLQAAVDAQQITMGKALEIRDQQLLEGWRKEQQAHSETLRQVTSVATEMNEYKSLVPNVIVPGSEERTKVEREYAYLVDRLGRPATKEQGLSMELTAVRSALGSLETLKAKQAMTTKPLPRESHKETSSAQKKADTTKDFKSTLSGREVQHYERLMRNGRYPGGWGDVQKEFEEYDTFKKTGVR